MLALLHAEGDFRRQDRTFFPDGVLYHSLRAGRYNCPLRARWWIRIPELTLGRERLTKIAKNSTIATVYQKSGRQFHLPPMTHRKRIPEK